VSAKTRINIMAISHNIRSSALNAHVNWDKSFGLAVVRRAIYDLAAVGRDLHGPQAMAETLYRQADLLIRGDDTPPDIEALIAQSDAIPVGEAEPKADPVAVKVPESVRKPRFGTLIDWFAPSLTVAFLLGILIGHGS
jgi:hypothetical protein